MGINGPPVVDFLRAGCTVHSNKHFKQEFLVSTDNNWHVLGSICLDFNPFTCSVSLVDYQNICGADKQTVACSSIHSICTFPPDNSKML